MAPLYGWKWVAKRPLCVKDRQLQEKGPGEKGHRHSFLSWLAGLEVHRGTAVLPG